MKRKQPHASNNFDSLSKAAANFAANARTQSAIQNALGDRKAAAIALENPSAFFASKGVKIPKRLTIGAFDHPLRSVPVPDRFPWIIEFFNCRTYFVRECDNSHRRCVPGGKSRPGRKRMPKHTVSLRGPAVSCLYYT